MAILAQVTKPFIVSILAVQIVGDIATRARATAGHSIRKLPHFRAAEAATRATAGSRLACGHQEGGHL